MRFSAKGMKILRSVPVLLLLAQLLAGCGGSKPPPLPPLATDAKILAFGDSLTAGYGATHEQAYPAQLATMVQHEVVNAGISGETTTEGRARLKAVLDETRPQLVILCEGANDLFRHLDHSQMRENLAAMIREIQGRNISVVLIAFPWPTMFGLKGYSSYAPLAKEFRAPLDEKTLADILKDDARKSDQIHPNAQGYHDLAAALAKLLHDAGAV